MKPAYLHYSQRNDERIGATLTPPSKRNLLAAGNRNRKPRTTVRLLSDTRITRADGSVEIIPRKQPTNRTTSNRPRVTRDIPTKRSRLATDYVGGDTWQTSHANAQDGRARNVSNEDRLSKIDAMIAEFEARAQ